MGTITLEINSGHLSEATYRQLRGRAFRHVAKERGGRDGNGTGLNLTMVVNDAWLRLRSTKRWDSRAHFFGSASTAVRRILIDAAKRRVCERRAMEAVGRRRAWSEPTAGVAEPMDTETAERIVMLDELVRQIAAIDEQWGTVVQRKVFGRVPNEIIAEELGVCVRTVERHIEHAKAWLRTRTPERVGRTQSRCRTPAPRSHGSR